MKEKKVITKNMKIIIFIPFPAWLIHSQLDLYAAILLQKMGYEITVMMCRTYHSKCPVLESIPDNQKLKTCEGCQDKGAWMKDLLENKYSIKVFELTSSETKEESGNITDRILDLASLETTFTAQRTGSYGLTDKNINQYYISTRSELSKILPRMVSLFNSNHFDIGFCFNGRFSTANMFVSLCKENEVPCIIHEKGVSAGSYKFLVEHKKLLGKNKINQLLKIKEQSLREQVKNVDLDNELRILNERISKGHKQTSHYAFLQDNDDSKNDTHWINLMKSKNKKIIGYFPSTFDEAYTQSELPRNQLKLLFDLSRIAKNDKDIAIIVRIHPNFWRRMGINNRDIVVESMIKKLKERAEDNYRIVDQNGIKSLELCEYIDGAIIPNSSLALDIRLREKISRIKILVDKASFYEDCGNDIASNLSDYLPIFINKIKFFSNQSDLHELENRYKEIAYSLWTTEQNISIKFQGIGSADNSPFNPDIARLKTIIETVSGFSKRDMSIINKIIWKSTFSEGYIN